VIPDISASEELTILRIGADGGMQEQPFLDYVLNMTNLRELRLEGCSLTGILPDAFGQLAELTR